MIWASLAEETKPLEHTVIGPSFRDMAPAFHWCLEATSDGQFHHIANEWTFEFEEDALLFALAWST